METITNLKRRRDSGDNEQREKKQFKGPPQIQTKPQQTKPKSQPQSPTKQPSLETTPQYPPSPPKTSLKKPSSNQTPLICTPLLTHIALSLLPLTPMQFSHSHSAVRQPKSPPDSSKHRANPPQQKTDNQCKVCDALKQVSLSKSPGRDGLPYEVYLRLLHMFVPILMDMFNCWFGQGAIPGNVTKGMITLLKKGGRHVWEGLDDYRPITLLNTELKIWLRS